MIRDGTLRKGAHVELQHQVAALEDTAKDVGLLADIGVDDDLEVEPVLVVFDEGDDGFVGAE